MTFKVETIEMDNFTRFLLGSQKRVAAAEKLVLNDLAFDTRKEAHRTIEKTMTTRSKFAQRQIRVEKVKSNFVVSRMFSLVGSVTARNFTGWVEQEYGKKTDRNVATKAGRVSGSTGKVIRRSNRLAKPYFTQKRFPHRGKIAARMGRSSRGGNWETPAMIGVLKGMKYRAPFILHRYKKIPAGLYKLDGEKIQMLQGFDPPKQQPSRNKWMQKSVRRSVTQARVNALWRKAAARTFKWGMR